MSMTLEKAAQSYWRISRTMLEKARTSPQALIITPQFELAKLLDNGAPERLRALITKSSRLAMRRCKNARIAKINAGQKHPTIYKKGDHIILGVKDKRGNIANYEGFLGRQDMTTGQWYVMTPDWQGMSPEKSFRHAPPAQIIDRKDFQE